MAGMCCYVCPYPTLQHKSRVHSFRCCSNNNNNNNNKPKPTQTPLLLKIVVTGFTELLRLFSSGQDRMDIVNDVQRYEVSVSSIDDVVMILNSDYENAYFVTAVNQLGIDKAVPKRILDMMNVEKLTRENVTSHLQKYRLYLKRISYVAGQQANIVAALGDTDSTYLQMSSLNGFGNYHSMAGSAQFQNATVGSFLSSGMLGRLKTPAVLGSRGLSSTGMIQHKFQPAILPGNQNGNTFQGILASLEFDQLQHNNSVEHFGDLSTGIFTSAIYSENCLFEDPTIKFRGTEVYSRNLKLLVPFFDCPSIALQKIEKGSTSEASFVLATWKLRTYLRLPWRPLISVDGSTIYDLDDKFKIVRHAESWDISALEAIGQIFTPSFGRPSE